VCVCVCVCVFFSSVCLGPMKAAFPRRRDVAGREERGRCGVKKKKEKKRDVEKLQIPQGSETSSPSFTLGKLGSFFFKMCFLGHRWREEEVEKNLIFLCARCFH